MTRQPVTLPKFLFRVTVELEHAGIKQWCEQASSCQRLHDNILKSLDRCRIDYKSVEVDLVR